MYAPVDVDLCGVNAANLLCDSDDHGESLVQLEEGDVIDGEVSLLQSNWQSDGRCFREVDRLNTGISPSYA